MNTALSSRGSFCIRQHPVLPGVFPHAVSTRGTRTVAALWPLLAIPDAPPACFRHWRRQAPVPLGAHGWKPNQVQCCTWLKTAREEKCRRAKKKPSHKAELFLWNPATSYSPGRFPSRSLPPGNSHSRVPWPLLAIPDAPPACFRHWRRQAPVPPGAHGWKPSQAQCMHSPEDGPGAILCQVPKQETPHIHGVFLVLESGNVLLSRAVSSQVPSALKGLTSVFGMGTGGSLSP